MAIFAGCRLLSITVSHDLLPCNSKLFQKWISIAYIENSMSKKISLKSEKVKGNLISHHIPKSLCHCCKHQWWAQSFFITYAENLGLVIDACSNRAQSFFIIYTKNCSLTIDPCSDSEYRASLSYIPKIAVSPLLYTSMGSVELL